MFNVSTCPILSIDWASPKYCTMHQLVPACRKFPLQCHGMSTRTIVRICWGPPKTLLLSATVKKERVHRTWCRIQPISSHISHLRKRTPCLTSGAVIRVEIVWYTKTGRQMWVDRCGSTEDCRPLREIQTHIENRSIHRYIDMARQHMCVCHSAVNATSRAHTIAARSISIVIFWEPQVLEKDHDILGPMLSFRYVFGWELSA